MFDLGTWGPFPDRWMWLLIGLVAVTGGEAGTIRSTSIVSHPRSPKSVPALQIHRRDGPRLQEVDRGRLLAMGFCDVGYNVAVPHQQPVWIGDDGAYTNTFHNNAGQDLILVVWEKAASFVNVNRPLVTLSLPPNKTITTSFEIDRSGAWAAVYTDTPSTAQHFGQIFGTWGEYTFNRMGVVDVSREVNMNGHPMTIVGPSCTSDVNRCVFECLSGVSCLDNYQLRNCDPGSQPGARYSIHEGHPSGGCGGLGDQADLHTYLDTIDPCG
jgi:hypothetical protein